MNVLSGTHSRMLFLSNQLPIFWDRLIIPIDFITSIYYFDNNLIMRVIFRLLHGIIALK